MSVVTIRFRSEALGKQTGFNVIHPDRGEGPFPVLMLLHGYSDDSFAWLYNANLVRYVADYPMIVVLPDGGTSRYLNLPYHERLGLQRYEDLLMQDIPREVNRLFQVRPGPWAVGGISMGGYGALRLGMAYPDRFCSVWAHSAGLNPLDASFLARLDDPESADIHALARSLAKRKERPVMAFDCGTEDGLLELNRDFDRLLSELGIAHTYQEHPGGHTWDFSDQHAPEALAQHAAVFEIVRQPPA